LGEKYFVSKAEGGALPVLSGTDVPLRFSKHPPFIYSIFFKSIPIHIPLRIFTQSYVINVINAGDKFTTTH
jgi:hypothetical protein